MQTLEEFRAAQAAKLKEFEARLSLTERVGQIPGLSWYIAHSPKRGWEQGAFKLDDLALALLWFKDHAVPVSAWEGRYQGLWPELPEPDYGRHVGVGVAELRTCAMLKHQSETELHVWCEVNGVRIEVWFPVSRPGRELWPQAVYADGGQHFKGWRKPTGHNYKQYLRSYTEMANLETLLATWADVEKLL